MSCVEIFKFTAAGTADSMCEVRNSWRFAMAVWHALEEKYLPPYRPFYVPDWVPVGSEEAFLHYKPHRVTTVRMSESEPDPMKEIWELYFDDRLSEEEKIVLGTTFDYVLVKAADLPKVIAAYKAFEGETNLLEQCKVLEMLQNDAECTAVGWNGTSVCADNWGNYGGYDEESDEMIPYNYLTMDKHWWLFDEHGRLVGQCGE